MSTLLDTAWRAARLITKADGLIITAGAGMGVDSGLPDFRGPQGFWRTYPALGQLSEDHVAAPRAPWRRRTAKGLRKSLPPA